MNLDLKILRTIADAGLAFIGKKIDTVGEKISSALKRDSDREIASSISNQTRTFERIGGRIEAVVEKIKEPQFDVSVDLSPLTSELKGIARDVKSISKLKVPDIKNIETMLKLVLKALSENKPMDMSSHMTELKDAFGKIKTYDTVKIDGNQMQALMGTLRQPSITTSGAVLSATRVTLYNTAITATNTQYPFTFPSNTVAWTIKLRDQGTLGYYSYTTGTLPVVGGGGDASNYATIPQNFLQSKDGVDWGGIIIYLGAESASQVAEITVYRA